MPAHQPQPAFRPPDFVRGLCHAPMDAGLARTIHARVRMASKSDATRAITTKTAKNTMLDKCDTRAGRANFAREIGGIR